MQNGVYFKSWTGSVNGVPPTGGGGGTGRVHNVTARNVVLDRVNLPIHLYQTNGGHSQDLPSTLMFGGLHFANWSGTALVNKIVDIEWVLAMVLVSLDRLPRSFLVLKSSPRTTHGSHPIKWSTVMGHWWFSGVELDLM
ncbi:hypothetical protein B0H10DRAFT_2195558 [Mycena sp. CBHHK59/15]|nr:hypothetical protein B0H10DRAFT_2195558 [Mycena sp. CBHHK59/15]